MPTFYVGNFVHSLLVVMISFPIGLFMRLSDKEMVIADLSSCDLDLFLPHKCECSFLYPQFIQNYSDKPRVRR